MKTKICTKCGKKFLATLIYFPPAKRNVCGLSLWCRNCTRIYSNKLAKTPDQINRRKNWIIKHKDTVNKVARRSALKRLYGITPEEYDILVRKQNNKCKTCHRPDPSGRKLAVDHNHITGKIRGLLCCSCNRLLGRLEKNNLLQSFMEYLSCQQ